MRKQPSRLYFPALTGLRFVAASMVFLLHYNYAISLHVPDWVAKLLGEFHTGVAIFFVLSGFLITHQYQHYSFSSVRTYWFYFLTRLGRILPLYIPVFWELHSRWLFSIPDLALHLTLLKGYFKKVHLSGVVQAWTLTVELSFYTLAPLIFWLARKGSILLPYILTLLTGVFLTGIGHILSIIGYNAYGFMPDLSFTAWNTFFGRSTEFFMGMGLAYYLNSRTSYKITFAPFPGFYTYSGLSLFGLLLFLITMEAKGNNAGITTWYGMGLHNLILPFSIVVLLYGLMHEKSWLSQILSSPLFILLGNASYAFYLFHLGRVGNIAAKMVDNSLLLQFTLLWVFSVFTYLVWEKPIYKWVKNKLQRLT